MSANSLFKLKFLLKKYLANDCTEDQLFELFELIRDEKNEDEVERILKSTWADSNFEEDTEPDSAALFSKIKGKIEDQEQPVSLGKKSGLYLYISIAASLSVCVTIAVHFISLNSNTTAVRTVSRATVKEAPYEQKRILLADGSVVTLNKGSRLKYPKVFKSGAREVYLTGEGYFDIFHDRKHPFIVHAGKLVTRVLGTAFNIKAYPKDTSVEVVVTRGKVQVTDGIKNRAILLADQRVSYNKTTAAFKKENTNAKIAVLWKEGDLVLTNATLREATKIITERYGYEVRVSSESLGSCRFTVTFLGTTPLPVICKVLSELNNASYQLNDKEKKLTFFGNGCQ